MATGDSQFDFLRGEWPMLFEPAVRAESLVYPDSRSSCFHARRALELAVHWLYKHDADVKTSLPRSTERADSRTERFGTQSVRHLRQDEGH